MKILFVGDSHGDLNFLKHAINVAVESGADKILQLGDFGYWEHRQHGIEFLDDLDHALSDAGMAFHWIDGNHENHKLLRERYGPFNGTFVNIRDNVIHIPRGTYWEWDDVGFIAMGGAHSVDAEERIKSFRKKTKHIPSHKSVDKYRSWWPEEIITDEDVSQVFKWVGGQVDVLVSHDVPTCANIETEFAIRALQFWKDEPISAINRDKLQRIMELLRPTHVYHGHYHLRYAQIVNIAGVDSMIQGLDCNVNQYGTHPWSWSQALVLEDTEDIRARSIQFRSK